MGMFSYLCVRCGHPALSPNACDKTLNDWMSDVVVLCASGPFTRGGMHAGEYDGYGRVGGADLHESGAAGFTLYHRACWELAGKPLAFSAQSRGADDQGWFFDDGDHDMLDPRTTQFMAPEVIAARVADLAAERDGWKRGYRFKELDAKADPGTQKELVRMMYARARTMPTAKERIAAFGCDILKYDEAEVLADCEPYVHPYPT